MKYRQPTKQERNSLDSAIFDFLFQERTDLEAERPSMKFKGRSQYAISQDPTVRAVCGAIATSITNLDFPDWEIHNKLMTNSMKRQVNSGMVVKQGHRVKRFMTYGSYTRNQNLERAERKAAHQRRTDKYWDQHNIFDARAELIDMIRGAGPSDLMIIRQALRTV